MHSGSCRCTRIHVIEVSPQLLVHARFDCLLAERAFVLLLEPRLNAFCMEHVPHIARQGRHHFLLLVFRVLLELLQADGALHVVAEDARAVSLLDEAVSEHGQAFFLFNSLSGHLAVHIDEDRDEQKDEEAHKQHICCRNEAEDNGNS